MIRRLLVPAYNIASLATTRTTTAVSAPPQEKITAQASAMATTDAAATALNCRLSVRAEQQNSAAATTRKLERLFSMQGGKGETSYARNSQGQAKHWRSVRPMLEEALQGMALRHDATAITVADLGCSSGRNTLSVVAYVVEVLQGRYSEESPEGATAPEFQAFFSDLPSNDFNTLFNLLPDADRRGYHAAGVPGSFYGRLFPARSVDVFHSSFSLHWLSQVPDAVVADRHSPAWNGGRVFIHGGPPAPAAAYLEQFRRDLHSFLRARGSEARPGACVFLVCLGRTSADPADQGGGGLLFGTHFESAWADLVVEGLVPSERRDSFNLPLFAPTAEELLEVVRGEGSFRADRVEIFNAGSPLVLPAASASASSAPTGAPAPADVAVIAAAFTNTCRTVCGVLVEHHLGPRLAEELFSRVHARAARQAYGIMRDLQFHHVVAALTRV